MAATSHSKTLHCVTSRSIRRNHLIDSPDLNNMRTSFQKIVIGRQKLALNSNKFSLAERFLQASANTSQGASSDGSSESREGELRRALDGALGSLSALHEIYTQREERWGEERKRISDDRENVELLMNQALGNTRHSAHTSEV